MLPDIFDQADLDLIKQFGGNLPKANVHMTLPLEGADVWPRPDEFVDFRRYNKAAIAIHQPEVSFDTLWHLHKI
ncbi:MAG TPA: hypothetical protein VG839_03320 [Asticcacaulis sp.]|nr:hypothetical protein [Asticcacaulis sp.]